MNIDHACSYERRVYIRHLSARDIPSLINALDLILKHSWTNLNADSVRIDLHQFVDENDSDEQLKTNQEIKDILSMNKFGFKWKQLINEPSTGIRY